MAIELPLADRELMQGVTDMHLHCEPCLHPRPLDEIEAATQARDSGYRALVVKSIYTPNADRVQLVRKVVPGIELFGGIVMNHPVGGLNPEALRAAIGFGAKIVWLPTVHAANHMKHFGVPTYPWLGSRLSDLPQKAVEGIRLLDEAGRLKPEVSELLELAGACGVLVSTGHIDRDEALAVCRRAREIGGVQVIVTHVGWHCTDYGIEATRQMIADGAVLEFCLNPHLPARQQLPFRQTIEHVKAVGAAQCIASTDLGQYDNVHPVEGFRMWLRMLLTHGLSDGDVDLMARRNPARLLGLGPWVPPAPAAVPA